MHRVSSAALLACVALLMSVPAWAETVFVSNEQDNTVSVIDGSTLTQVKTIPVGRRPRGIALSPDNMTLYVAAGDDDRIDMIDVKSGKVVGALPSGDDPELFAVHPDGKRLFVSNENDNEVSAVDIAAKKVTGSAPVGVEPEGMAASHDGKLVACTSETTSMVHLIDAATMKPVANYLVDPRPRFVAFSPDDKTLWVTSELRGTLTALDTATGKQLAHVSFPISGLTHEQIQAVGITLTKAGNRVFVSLGPANRVAEVDPQSFAVTRMFLVGNRVWHTALSPDEKRLYAANGNSGDVSVIDLASNQVIKSVKAGRGPWGVAVAP
jgi:PQQ-dependent catabolism-associated beta-propeller protein